MKRIVLSALILVLPIHSFTQPAKNDDTIRKENIKPLYPTVGALLAVRIISIGMNSGTCFVGNYKGTKYIITAKHLFDTAKTRNGDTISFKISDTSGFLYLNSNVYFHSTKEIDVAILKTPATFSPKNALIIPEKEFWIIGQECYFLGFPLGLSTPFESNLFPLYKRAIFSGVLHDKNGLCAFDAHNNIGFSGAPIISTNSSYDKQFIVGVVFGYQNEKKSTEIRDMATSKSQIIFTNENSGIMLAFDSKKIIEIILENNLF